VDKETGLAYISGDPLDCEYSDDAKKKMDKKDIGFDPNKIFDVVYGMRHELMKNKVPFDATVKIKGLFYNWTDDYFALKSLDGKERLQVMWNGNNLLADSVKNGQEVILSLQVSSSGIGFVLMSHLLK
jgi:hypothetical protein